MKHGSQKELEDNPIDEKTIEGYIDAQSDFAFEMAVLNVVKNVPFIQQVKRGGVYNDPRTRKQREYDIRCVFITEQFPPCHWVNVAIECKHIKPSFPLVVSCTQRADNENSHDCWRWRDDYHIYERQNCTGCHSSFVGRAVEQIGVNTKKEFISADDGAFDKWSQALASLHDMLQDALTFGSPQRANVIFLPVVVVPDDTLWQVNYDEKGKREGSPVKSEHVEYWVDVKYTVQSVHNGGVGYNVPCLHFFTFSGLKKFLNGGTALNKLFH